MTPAVAVVPRTMNHRITTAAMTQTPMDAIPTPRCRSTLSRPQAAASMRIIAPAITMMSGVSAAMSCIDCERSNVTPYSPAGRSAVCAALCATEPARTVCTTRSALASMRRSTGAG